MLAVIFTIMFIVSVQDDVVSSPVVVALGSSMSNTWSLNCEWGQTLGMRSRQGPQQAKNHVTKTEQMAVFDLYCMVE